MRNKVRAAIAAAAAAALLFTAAPANAAGSGSPGTITEVAVAASGGGALDNNHRDYDILVQALVATGLDGVLADPSQKFTVFAPTDYAFMRLVKDLTGTYPASESDALNTVATTLTPAQLTEVLLYHVVAGKRLGPIKVITSQKLTMADGGIVRPRGITLRDETPALKDPRLVLWRINIGASNGVIHTIDRVLVPSL